ncbi:MAG TPA: N-acetylmuramoyl-L-alanine amidase [Chlamydiales bacterium]|nr:N-acetylmuramoyl-L-alanine amidase [Chlamydiales bacterium]
MPKFIRMQFVSIIVASFFVLAAVPAKKEPGTPLATKLSASGPMIVIDPGHGGRDIGARAKDPYCEEKKITLTTARLVKKYLTQLGYRVAMTRDSDADISLAQRVEIAAQADADLFVSVHFNSTRNQTVKGIEVFFSESSPTSGGASPSKVPSSRRLADVILPRLILRTGTISRGVKRGNFYVIRETTMPAVLVEGGFISNQDEREQLRTREFQDKIARGIADGIDVYFKKK